MRSPFRDATFDTVVSSCSIKHWPDPAAGVREMRRVLRRAVRRWAPSVGELADLVGSPATKVAGLPYAFVVHNPK